MIEQPQAPVRPVMENRPQNSTSAENMAHQHYSSSSSSTTESSELLREVKQLRQDVQFLRQLLEHVQNQLR